MDDYTKLAAEVRNIGLQYRRNMAESANIALHQAANAIDALVKERDDLIKEKADAHRAFEEKVAQGIWVKVPSPLTAENQRLKEAQVICAGCGEPLSTFCQSDNCVSAGLRALNPTRSEATVSKLSDSELRAKVETAKATLLPWAIRVLVDAIPTLLDEKTALLHDRAVDVEERIALRAELTTLRERVAALRRHILYANYVSEADRALARDRLAADDAKAKP
jgi:hypothetical protein